MLRIPRVMRLRIRTLAGATALISVLSGIGVVPSALAAPITYNEATDGDLPGLPTTAPFTTLTFDFGVNTITGVARLHTPEPDLVNNDVDPFTFILPPGRYLNGPGVVDFQMSQEGTGTFNLLVATYYLAAGDCTSGSLAFNCPPPLTTGGVNLLGLSPQSIWTQTIGMPASPITLGPGIYTVLQSWNLGQEASSPGTPVSYSYTLRLSVENTPNPPIPEPSTVVLLGSALGVLAARRLRTPR